MNRPNALERFDLRGRKALVTGASSGLGRHFAVTLAAAEAQVALAARRVDLLREAVAEIEGFGGRAMAVAMDVADRASVIAALDRVGNELGTVDVLINNAGVSGTKRAQDYDDADWELIVGTNLRGAWTVAQETARRLIKAQQPGSIVNVTSILGSRVLGGVSPYIASKAGLKQLTQSLALEWARHRIRVNSLAPGYVSTDMNKEFLGSDVAQKIQQRVPARRFGTPEDLDGALLLLASDAGAYITGSEIVVDGGHLCSSL